MNTVQYEYRKSLPIVDKEANTFTCTLIFQYYSKYDSSLPGWGRDARMEKGMLVEYSYSLVNS